jgi:spore coat protein A
LLRAGAFAGAYRLFGGRARASEVELLDPHSQPQFVNALPVPGAMQPAMPGGAHYEVAISQLTQHLGLYDPWTNSPLMTTVWGYNGSYPGATFEARRDLPITVRWKNELVDGGGMPLAHLLPVDTTVHWAMPMAPEYPASGVPVVTHVHGGHSRSDSDGLPEAWFTPGFAQVGPLFNEIYTYDNDQEAATLWYHDHALGITRLNVYAGLAGFYMLRDAWEDSLNLPSGPYEIPIAIQDRMFLANGSLFYPSEPEVEEEEGEEEGELEPPAESVLPEFFGDFILVNGKAWPVLDVEPRKYRFRFLNGSDSRFYDLWLESGQPFYQIGTDGGLLYSPVMLSRLVLGPGERADTVLDFSDPALWGMTIILRNNARAPFPKGETIDPATVGRIMAFRVVLPLAGPDTSHLPAILQPAPLLPPGPSVRTRQLLLFEGTDEYGRLQPLLGTVADGPLKFSHPVTENPMLDDVEIWEVFNNTEDAHPIHLHLVQFQILNRQKFHAKGGPKMGMMSHFRAVGRARPPAANEAGWKDTAQMFPGQVTRIIAKFDRPGGYVWHCHILSHEDHEMMRPYYVGPMS